MFFRLNFMIAIFTKDKVASKLSVVISQWIELGACAQMARQDTWAPHSAGADIALALPSTQAELFTEQLRLS